MKMKKSTLIITAVVIVVMAVIVIGCIVAIRHEADKKGVISEEDDYSVGEERTDEPEEAEGTDMFAIFGVDSRSGQLGEGTRSDSIMIISLDHGAKTVRVASIYRDCMVHIEGHNYEKITHAHSYGGPELAMETINENFDLNIENYVTVNFESVAELVDKIGGVDIDITEEEADILKSDYPDISEAGVYTLDGEEAVSYSRIRHAEGGDYRRSERQRTVLFEIFDKTKEMETDERLEIMNDMMGEINTNYSSTKIAGLLYYMSQYSEQDTTAFPEVFYGGTVDGAWVEVPVTLTDMAKSIHEFFYKESDYEPSETVKEYSDALSAKASTANTDLRE